MNTEESKEQLWDRLSNESARAYEAFKIYMYMNLADRSVVGAWREWTGNPEAVRPSPFFEEWAREYAWSDRARAHDHHIELIRERGMEKAIEEEAEFQARQVEQVRFRYQELLSVAYSRAMEWFEDSDWSRADLRASDVLNIIQLHAEATEKLGEPAVGPEAEGDWDEEDIDDEIGRRIVEEVDAAAEERRSEADDTEPESKDEDDWEEDGAEIVKEVDALPYLEHPDLGEEDKEGSEEGSDEDRSEESEDGQDK